MQGEGLEWGEGYRGLGRDAIAAILLGQMAQAVDEHSIGSPCSVRLTGATSLIDTICRPSSAFRSGDRSVGNPAVGRRRYWLRKHLMSGSPSSRVIEPTLFSCILLAKFVGKGGSRQICVQKSTQGNRKHLFCHTWRRRNCNDRVCCPKVQCHEAARW